MKVLAKPRIRTTPGVVSTGTLSVATSGTTGPGAATSQSSAAVQQVNAANGLSLDVTDTTTTKAVKGLATTLHADVIVGGGAKKLSLDLSTDEENPGHYEGSFIPTKTGDYIFHIFGDNTHRLAVWRFDLGLHRGNNRKLMLRLQKLWIVGIHFRDRFDREIIIRSRVQGERAIAGTDGKIIRSTRALKTFEHLRHDRIHRRLFEIRN